MHEIFKPDNPHGNIVFNLHNDPISDLSAFAKGYHNAAKSLVERFEAAPRIGCVDYFGYPIFFLYRHALELYLKAVVSKGKQVLGLLDIGQIDTEKLFCNHNLTNLLPPCRKIFDAMEWSDFEDTGLNGFSDFENLKID